MSFPAYESYRDSGVSWIGDVPSCWGIARLGFEAETLVPMRDKPNDLTGPIPWVRIEDFTGKYLSGSKSQQGVTRETVNLMNLKVFPAGTVLCSCSCTMGATAIASRPLVSNQTFIGISPGASLSSEYLYYLFQASAEHLNSIGTGAIQTYLSRDDFRALRLPKPSLIEQQNIAAFLDRETGKIDALVEAQRRLIELLKEKRQAVISHAVTKGLDPAAPMKGSGVEWLGQVPAHWEVKALKHVGEFNAGAGFPDAEQGLQFEELPFHKVNALALADADDFLTTGENTVSRETAKRLGAYVFPADSIVFAKIGAALLLGRLRRLPAPACLDNNMMGLTVHAGNDLEFVRSAMSLVKFDLISNPGTVPSLNKGQIANAVIAVPPLIEQEAISIHLQQTAFRYRELSTQADAAISLLQERRAALISAAVTGKIDVRGIAPKQAEAA